VGRVRGELLLDARRPQREEPLYVSIWFYISTVLTIAVLFIVNNLSLPVTGTKSYGAFAGAQDALTQ